MEKILSYKNVSFRRDGREILKDINWKIKKGENWALLGLNGSGKSTLLSMIPAYTFATSGEVSVFEKKFGTCVWAEVKEKVGFVSSSLNTFSDSLNNQTLNNIVLSGKYNSIGIYQEITQKDREKANNIIKDFKLSHLKLNKYITLSQGEQRKTLLARAFMNEPSLLILDEPCSGLDIRAREIFLKTLEESKSDIPFIYVTHQIEEIISSITHVAILDNGEIMSQGNKFEVLTEENLSKLYGIDLKIEWSNNRPWLIVK
ncbi:molybdenum ABC transporter ATP-binding protein [Fusobacterium pseudoperiodonticum]|uniref:Molybdenum ABC transporter ATP-binding protein n=1 Tax=Fusobacterium pseudoperiodonticum TaxID=2663009 RepID=A0AAD0ASP4_9FUSO|nr:ATP-binding cassette domain-containing protein [Fusobacterium pseudoperiodonticum]ATV66978.1 molybdenum ABC transporter ATP-binding protein [Fusobacterium pseudoperiodonticum]